VAATAFFGTFCILSLLATKVMKREMFSIESGRSFAQDEIDRRQQFSEIEGKSQSL
jgi:hypothetical protein